MTAQIYDYDYTTGVSKVPRRVTVSTRSKIYGEFEDIAAGAFMRKADSVPRENKGDLYACFYYAAKSLREGGANVEALYDALDFKENDESPRVWGDRGVYQHCINGWRRM